MTGCFIDQISLDANVDNKKVAITGWITSVPGDQYISITRSTEIDGTNSIDIIDNVYATISTDDEIIILEQRMDGLYYLPDGWVGEIGETYVLEVSVDDIVYASTEIMQPSPMIGAVILDTVFSSDSLDTLFQTMLTFEDLPESDNGYYTRVYTQGNDFQDLFSGLLISEMDLLDSDAPISVSDNLFKSGDTIIIELHSIGAAAIDYLTDIREGLPNLGNPFTPAPVNAISNISNGGVGFFIVSGVETVEVILE